MSIGKMAVVALVVGFRTTIQRTVTATRMDLGARFLERICDQLAERAEASWNWPSDEAPPAEKAA